MSSNSSSPTVSTDNGRGRPKLAHQTSSTQLLSTHGTGSKKGHSKIKAHNRSMSHNKLLNKLSTSSNSSAHLVRPNLNRSKSTDGLVKTRPGGGVKRNNRSFTKLSGLQPLTKTVSGQSLKSNKSNSSLKGMNPSSNLIPLSGLKTSGRKGKAILKLNDDFENEEYEDLENDEDKDLTPESFHVGEDGKKYNNFNSSEDVYRQPYYDLNNESSNIATRVIPESESSLPYVQTVENMEDGNKTKIAKPDYPHQKSNEYIQSSGSSIPSVTEQPQQGVSRDQSKDSNKDMKNLPTNYSSAQSSTDDLVLASNMYGGSLLLSQSTGLTKKFDAKGEKAKLASNDVFSNANYKNIGNNSVSDNQPFVGNNSESISGISFQANPIIQTQNIAEPVTTNKNVIQNNSYQPNQTIFSNLKRTNSQFMSNKKGQNHQGINEQDYPHISRNITEEGGNQNKSQNEMHNGVNNFSNFLNSSSTDQHNANNIETRTQQRLWLQRENSLMDLSNFDSNLANGSNLSLNHLMFAHNFNSVSNNGGNGSLISNTNYFNQARDNMQQQGMFPITPGGFNAPQSSGGNNSLANIGKLHNNQINEITSNGSLSLSANSMNMGNPIENSSTTNINGLLLMVQNNHQNSIQSRTEFERLNREYLNVRRNSNPVGEGLSRVNQYFLSKEIDIPKSTKKQNGNTTPLIYSQTSASNGNSFKEVSKVYQENEITQTLNKLWQDAVMSSLSSTPTNARIGNGQNGQNQSLTFQNQLIQSQRPVNPRGGSFNQAINYSNLRAPHTPTTRAVKLAAQTQNKRSNEVNIN